MKSHQCILQLHGQPPFHLTTPFQDLGARFRPLIQVQPGTATTPNALCNLLPTLTAVDLRHAVRLLSQSLFSQNSSLDFLNLSKNDIKWSHAIVWRMPVAAGWIDTTE